MPGRLGRGGMLGNLATSVSRAMGENVGVSKRVLGQVGLGNAVGPKVRRTKVIGPRSGNANAANLVTGRGSNRTFISNNQYAQIHEARGRKVLGGAGALGTMGVINSDANKKGYYNPISTPKGTGRFA